jgi:hypothetical protein
MPNESWVPSLELRLIFRHTVVSIAIVAAVWVCTQAVVRFVPEVEARHYAELIDTFVLLGVLAILGARLILTLIFDLIREFRGDGLHAFVAA